MQLVDNAGKIFGVLIAGSSIIGAIAIAGQKLLTLEEAVKNQKTQTTEIEKIQTQQSVIKMQQSAIDERTKLMLQRINENHAIMLQILQK